MSGRYLDKLLANIKNDPYYSPTHCPWHYDSYCFMMTTNNNNKRFHCLFDKDSTKWTFYNSSRSCDIPEYFYDLIELNKKLGHSYVLPFSTHIRESFGNTIGLYEIRNGHYNAKILKAEHLFETFLTFIVILCEVCYLYGGQCPLMNNMKFIYTEKHPVLVDVGKSNNSNREKIGSDNKFNEKKWKRFLNNRTTKEIIHYVKLCHPLFFKKKCPVNRICILSENESFSDETHNLICKSKKHCLKDILVAFKNSIPNLNSKIEKIVNVQI